MNFYSIPPLLISILLFILGIFVLSKNIKSKLNFVFFLLCLTSSVWLFSNFIAFSKFGANNVSFWLNLAYCGVVFIAITIFHYTVTFLNIKKLNFYIPFNYLIGFLIVFLIWRTDYILSGKKHFFWGYYPLAGIFNPAFIIYFVTLGTFSFIFLVYFGYFKKPSVPLIKKMQIKYMLFAMAIYNFASVDFVANYRIALYPFGYIATFIFILIISYTIIRFRLMDVTIVITRAGIFMFVYSLILGVPLLLIYYFQNYFASIFGVSWWIIPFLCSTALSAFGPFLYLYFDKKAEDRILREQKNYQNILKGASAGMIRIKNLNILTKLIVYVVAKTVKLKHASIFLLDQENQVFKLYASRMANHLKADLILVDNASPLIRQLSSKNEPIVAEEVAMRLQDDVDNFVLSKLHHQLIELRAALVVPSFVENRLIGMLILGEKRSSKLYSQDDIVVFSVLANQAALAIENAQFYEEIKQTHEQLFQAEKMATIGTMADGLSHQINNRFHALSLIAGDSLDMLKTFDWSVCNEGTKQIMTDLKSALERIENNVLQGGEIVKGILKYSRPGDSGFESVDFKEVLNGAIEMVQYKIKLKEIDIVQNIPADLPKLYGNLTQLQEVFFNLIDNAYDAIKERQMTLKEEGYRGKIEVTADRSSNSMEIRVTDNGIGVKDLDKRKLFAPFFTTKATAKKGTGLGLYVIEKIIASHNGKIDIESTYKSGTRFIIILPTTPSAT